MVYFYTYSVIYKYIKEQNKETSMLIYNNVIISVSKYFYCLSLKRYSLILRIINSKAGRTASR